MFLHKRNEKVGFGLVLFVILFIIWGSSLQAGGAEGEGLVGVGSGSLVSGEGGGQCRDHFLALPVAGSFTSWRSLGMAGSRVRSRSFVLGHPSSPLGSPG